MRTILLTFTISLLSLFSFSQITVTDIDLLDAGDYVYLAEDYNPSINLGGTGQNQNWDFSSLQNNDYYKLDAISPNGTPFEQFYSNANLVIEDEGDLIYINKSASGLHMLGIGDSVFQQPAMVIPLPLSYGASFTDGPTLVLDSLIGGPMVNILLTSQGLSASLLTFGAAHVADSISIKLDLTTEFNVDAEGSLTLPMGVFDALRVKVERLTSTDIAVYCIDTNSGANSGWYPLPFGNGDVETGYQWYSNSAKFTLVDLFLDSIGNQDGSVTFLTNSLTSINPLSLDDIQVFPSPSSDYIKINSSKNELILARLLDVNGKEITNFNFFGSKEFNMSEFSKGIYFLELKTNDGSIVKKVILE